MRKRGKCRELSRIKDKNGRLAQGEDKVQRIWNEYFEDLYNIDTQEHMKVHMCCFDGIRKGNYLGGKPVGRNEIGVRVGKLQNGKAAGGEEATIMI